MPKKLPRYQIFVVLILLGSHLLACSSIQAKDNLAYKLKYVLAFLPETEQAQVSLFIDKGHLLHSVEFDYLPSRYDDIQANGELTITDTKVHWKPPQQNAKLSLKVKIPHQRDPGEFDAMITKDWAIFRGDDMFPAVKTRVEDGSYAVATLEVSLPAGWKSIETGWPRLRNNVFRINNPTRKFDRPTGWMIAGSLGTRRDDIAGTSIAVSAPKGSDFHRMDILAYFNFVWPEVEKAFKKTPDKLLVIGMGDPMWRGGLSGPNSLFIHADRPIVSENGTSPLLHELVHMVTRIRGKKTDKANDDWIVEGLAELYSFELLYRAGGMTRERRDRVIRKLKKWGKDVKSLREKNSTGRFTARAVVLMDELDQEIQQRSENKYSIDDVTRALMAQRKVSLEDLTQVVEQLINGKSETLKSPLLQ